MWEVKTFDQLTKDELLAIFKERIAVFVVEQNCPYPDIDDFDKEAIHIFLKGQDEQLLAYCRLIPTDKAIKLGRVLVKSNARGTGLGKDLVAKALSISKDKYPDKPVFAQAQVYLQNFYSDFGFTPISEPYLEDNIPHIDMLLEEVL